MDIDFPSKNLETINVTSFYCTFFDITCYIAIIISMHQKKRDVELMSLVSDGAARNFCVCDVD